MLRLENNDFRNKDNQLHETQKIKTNDLQEAEKYIQYLKEKSKQVIQKEHNEHTYKLQYLRTDEQKKLKADELKN